MDVYDYEKKNVTMIRDDTENTDLVPNKYNLLRSFRKIIEESKKCEGNMDSL